MGCKCQEPQVVANTPTVLSQAEPSRAISGLPTTGQPKNREYFIDRSEYRKRLETCRECDKVKYFLGRMRCGECGCFLELKAAVTLMECPLGKWAH